MKLPIYRRLDERLQILGLSILELAILGGLYIFLAEILSFWSYGIVIALVVCLAGFIGLLYLHRHFESHYIQKWIRFAALPEGLSHQVQLSKGNHTK